MRKSLLLAVSILGICALVPAALFAGGRAPNCGTDNTISNPKVHIDGTPNDHQGFNITSDGLLSGDYQYINTKGYRIDLKFQIDNCSYDFTMNLFNTLRTIKVYGTPMDTTSGFFNFDRLGSVPITVSGLKNGGSPTPYDTWCSKIVKDRYIAGSLTDRSFETYLAADGITKLPYDNYMPCGCDQHTLYAECEPGNTFFARRSVHLGLAIDYALAFQDAPIAIDKHTQLANGTSPIKVYHLSPNMWELKPDKDAYTYDPADGGGGFFSVGTGEKAALLPNNGSPPGYPIMPFRMLITTTP